MKNRIKVILTISLFLFNGYGFAALNLNGKIHSLLQDFKEKNQIGAITLALSFPDESAPRIFNLGNVSEENKSPVHMGNLFQIGSVTKSFISSVILKLQEEKRLSIHDPLSQWLPQYPIWGNITIKQLMNHTSGIYNYTDSDKFRMYLLENQFKQIEPDELIQFSLSEPPYFNPGEGWHYSNTGYILLGKIIEKATSKSIDAALSHFILDNDAFNFLNTAFIEHQYPIHMKNRMTHGYFMFAPGDGVDITDVSMSWQNSAGGMVSNVYDMSSWIRALFTGKVLNNKSFSDFTSLVSIQNGQPVTNPAPIDPEAYGLGIQAYETNMKNIGIIWWHSGSTLGYKSLMMWLPGQKIAIAITYNQVLAGQENTPFSPNTELPQRLLHLVEVLGE